MDFKPLRQIIGLAGVEDIDAVLAAMFREAYISDPFDESPPHQRYYNKAGQRLPSVTGILGVLNKPALVRWAWRLGQEGKNPDEEKNSWRGTLIHSACETGDPATVATLTEPGVERFDLYNNYDAFCQWCESNNVTIMPQHKEVKLISERHGYGGTCDFVCTVPAASSEGIHGDLLRANRMLIDIKTGSGVYVDSMLPQLAAYAKAWQEMYPELLLDSVGILHLRDGRATLHKWRCNAETLQPAWDVFVGALRVYKAMKSLRATRAEVCE